MEKQMKAERERRESICRPKARSRARFWWPKAKSSPPFCGPTPPSRPRSWKLRAEKTAKILAAEAESEAIMKVQQATADALKLLNEAAPNDQVVKLKALEAMTKVADGKATKIIIPSELQGLAGLAASAKAVFESEEPKA